MESIDSFLKEIRNDIAEIKRNTASNANIPLAAEQKYVDGRRMKLEFGISDRTLQTWRDQGVVPWCRFQRKIYYPWAEIEAMLESKMRDANNPK
jgi:hypothetical protein